MKTTYDITIAGIPIGGLDRTTPETLRAFRQARVILDLTSYRWPLKRFCKRVVDLDRLYWTNDLDEEVYDRIADFVLAEASNGPRVVLAVDGHPGIYQDLSWDILRRGKRRGLRVQMLPAISCLDAMIAFCDLELDAHGMQIFEATSIVAFNVQINPFVDLLLMQVGWFGTSVLSEITSSKSGRFTPLVKHLAQYYPPDHRVKVLSAGHGRNDASKSVSIKLGSLDRVRRAITTETTLYVPALLDDADSNVNEEFVRQTESPHNLTIITAVGKKSVL